MMMFIVELIKGDHFSYMSAPNEALSWTTADGIMKTGHALPSVALAGLFSLWLMPRISTEYAQKLEMNEPIVPITIFISLIPILILNGFIIEWYLEKYHKGYKEAKAEAKAKP